MAVLSMYPDQLELLHVVLLGVSINGGVVNACRWVKREVRKDVMKTRRNFLERTQLPDRETL